MLHTSLKAYANTLLRQIIFIFPHCVVFFLLDFCAATGKSRDSIHITDWPDVSWNLSAKSALWFVRISAKEISKKSPGGKQSEEEEPAHVASASKM